MGRKTFQELAHVLCQKFIEVPSNRDLVTLAILGDGILALDITGGQATHNSVPIQPLPYADEWGRWATDRLKAMAIPRSDLTRATLTVDYRLELRRKAGLGWLGAQFDMHCTGFVSALDHEYHAEITAVKEWGFSQV
jgi:hypothetical protein